MSEEGYELHSFAFRCVECGESFETMGFTPGGLRVCVSCAAGYTPKRPRFCLGCGDQLSELRSEQPCEACRAKQDARNAAIEAKARARKTGLWQGYVGPKRHCVTCSADALCSKCKTELEGWFDSLAKETA